MIPQVIVPSNYKYIDAERISKALSAFSEYNFYLHEITIKWLGKGAYSIQVELHINHPGDYNPIIRARFHERTTNSDIWDDRKDDDGFISEQISGIAMDMIEKNIDRIENQITIYETNKDDVTS